MQSRRIIIATSIPLAIVAKPAPAKALVKGHKPPAKSDMSPDAYSSPIQYDVEELMTEVGALNRRMDGTDIGFNLMALQVMVTGVFAAWTRK